MTGNGNVLIVNTGSSTVKFRLYSGDKIVLDEILEGNDSKTANKIISRISGYKIDKVTYRVVHGGDLTSHSVINDRVLNEIKKVSNLAPLHNIPFLKIYDRLSKKIKAKHIACFDTAFHRSIPDVAKIYAIPSKLTSKYNIQRYGFHGLAHQYMAQNSKGNVITCQLGNGISITAVKNGKSVDTSMGFTPLEGLPMGTRSGNIDPSLVAFLSEKEGKSAKEIVRILNEESGLKGISGQSDVRELMKRKDKKARLALDLMIYNIRKYIGAYSTVLGKVDCIVFGGGISNDKQIISRIMHGINTKYKMVSVDEQEIMFEISKHF